MYIKLSDLSVYYQEIGRGKDLILLHGWKQDVSTFWGLVDLLKTDFRVYLIDLPGFGRSDSPQKEFTVSDYSKIVQDFIKTKKIKKPILLGHSLGGRIAIKLASENPQLISKLILEDSAGIKPKKDFFKFVIYFLAKLFRYFIPNAFNFKNKIRYLFYKKLETDYIDAGALTDTLKNILEEDLTDDLRKIRVETLLIWGEKDPTQEASLRNGKKMYQLIENSRIEIFDDVGHFPHLEKPERFAYYVKDFS